MASSYPPGFALAPPYGAPPYGTPISTFNISFPPPPPNGTSPPWPSPSPAPPPGTPGLPLADFIISGKNNEVTDASLRSAIVIDVIIGAICLTAFVFFQSKSILYKIRLVSHSVTIKPPPLPVGVSALWGWLLSTLTTSDEDLLQSCGLDALMFIKMLTYGVQLFTPVALLGVAVLLPVNMSGTFLESDPSFGNQATFMKTTMTNVDQSANVLWIHCIFVLLFIAWGCWLLKWHFHQYVTIRQHWLRTGDNENEWRALFQEQSEMRRQSSPGLANLVQQLTRTKLASVIRTGFDTAMHPLSGPPASRFSSPVPGQAPSASTLNGGSGDLSGRGEAPGDRALMSDPGIAHGDAEGARAPYMRSSTIRRRKKAARIAAAEAALAAVDQNGPAATPSQTSPRARQRRGSAGTYRELGRRSATDIVGLPGVGPMPGAAVLGGAGVGGSGGELQRLLEEELGQRPKSSSGNLVQQSDSSGQGRDSSSSRLFRGLQRFVTIRPRHASNSGSKEFDTIEEGDGRRLSTLPEFSRTSATSPAVELTRQHQLQRSQDASDTPVDSSHVVVDIPPPTRRQLARYVPSEVLDDEPPSVSTLPPVQSPPPRLATPSTLGAGPLVPAGTPPPAPEAPTVSQAQHPPSRPPPAPSVPPGAPGVPRSGGVQAPLPAAHAAGQASGAPASTTPGQPGAPNAGPGQWHMPLPNLHGKRGHRRVGSDSDKHLLETKSASREVSPRLSNNAGGSPQAGHSPHGRASYNRHKPPPVERGDSAPRATELITPSCLTELPQWWSGTRVAYDPAEVQRQRMEHKTHSRHRRTGSLGREGGNSLARLLSQGSAGDALLQPSGSNRASPGASGGASFLRQAGPSIGSVPSTSEGGPSMGRRSAAGHSNLSAGRSVGGSLNMGQPSTSSGRPTLVSSPMYQPLTQDSPTDDTPFHQSTWANRAYQDGRSQGRMPRSRSAADTVHATESVHEEPEPPVPHEPMQQPGSRRGQHEPLEEHAVHGEPGRAGHEEGPGKEGGGWHANANNQRDQECIQRPSVRHLKTMNTRNRWGTVEAVQAQQYAVLVTDVNQDLWTGAELWPKDKAEEGQGALSLLLPKGARKWVMSNYAVQALNLYDNSSDEYDSDGERWSDCPAPAPSLQGVTAAGSLVRPGSLTRPISPTRHTVNGHATSPSVPYAKAGVESGHFSGRVGELPLERDLRKRFGGEGEAHGGVDGPHAGAGEPYGGQAGAHDGLGRPHVNGPAEANGPLAAGAHQGRSVAEKDPPAPTSISFNVQLPIHEAHAASQSQRNSQGAGLLVRTTGPVAEGADDESPPASTPATNPTVQSPRVQQPNKLASPSHQLGQADSHLTSQDGVHGREEQQASIAQGALPAGWARSGPVTEGATATHRDPATGPQRAGSYRRSKDNYIAVPGESEGPLGATAEHDDSIEDEADALEKEKAEAIRKAAAKVRAREHWVRAKELVRSGKVLSLLLNARRYSVVTATFKRLFPEDFDRAIPVLCHKEVDLLLMKLDFHYNAYTEAEAKFKRKSQRPMGRLKMFGPKVDLLTHHGDQLEDLNRQIREARREATSCGRTPSWFVFFKSQTAAAVCSQSVIHSEDNREFKVHAAPGPEEVNWPALWMNFKQRDNRAWIVRPLLALLILFPVGIFAGGLQQLEFVFCPLGDCVAMDAYGNQVVVDGNPLVVTRTRQECPMNTTLSLTGGQQTLKWDWYCNKADWFAVSLSRLITAWLPSLLLMLWQNMVLPLAMLMLAQASGACLSYSMMDDLIASYIFWFNLWQGFIGGILGSALVQQISSLFQSGPGEALHILGTFLPSSSNFFMAYMLLRTFALIPMRLLTPHIGIRMYLLRRYVYRCFSSAPLSAREYAFLYANTSPRIGFEYGMALMTFLIPFTFAVLAPIMPVIGLGYFAFSWVAWRYMYLYVFIRKYESGGLMWRFVYYRMLVIFGVFGLFTACVLVVKQAYPQAIVLFVLVPFILARFNNFIYFRFLEALEHVPLTMARNAPRATVPPTCYIPPPMMPGSRGWHPEWPKPWQGWMLPTGYSVT